MKGSIPLNAENEEGKQYFWEYLGYSAGLCLGKWEKMARGNLRLIHAYNYAPNYCNVATASALLMFLLGNEECMKGLPNKTFGGYMREDLFCGSPIIIEQPPQSSVAPLIADLQEVAEDSFI